MRSVLFGLLFIGMSSARGQLWVSDDAARLWEVTPTNGQATKVGTMPVSMTDIAFAPWGDLYGIAEPDDIYQIDVTGITVAGTIPVRLIGSLNLHNPGPLANRREVHSLTFGPDGNAYFATEEGLRFSGGVFVAPTGTLGVITDIEQLRGGLIGDIGEGNGGDLVFVGDTLYMNSCDITGFSLQCSTTRDQELVRVNPPNGQGSVIGSIGFPNVFGLAAVDSTLYGVTHQGELLRINTSNGEGTRIANIMPPLRALGATTEPVFADYNGNGGVEQGDLDLVLLNWGKGEAVVPATWRRDRPMGLVDQAELDRILLSWGVRKPLVSQPMAGTYSIPELPTWQLAMPFVVFLVRFGKRRV